MKESSLSKPSSFSSSLRLRSSSIASGVYTVVTTHSVRGGKYGSETTIALLVALIGAVAGDLHLE